MPTSFRTRWFIVITILLSVSFSAVVAELSLRIAFPDPYEADSVLGLRHISGSDYDSRGFRNSSALDSADIVAIGDSQTEGENATADEAWPHVLGVIAKKSVYSIAIGSWGPVQYDALVKQALMLHPKLVIVGLYLGNDLADAERAVYSLPAWKELENPYYAHAAETYTDPATPLGAVIGNTAVPGSFRYTVLRVRLWIRLRSKLYALAGNGTRSLREKLGLAKTGEETARAIDDLIDAHPELAYQYTIDPRFKTILSPSERFQAINLENPQTAEGWRITKNRLIDMAAQLKAGGAFLLVVLIPTKEQIYLEYMKEKRQPIPETFSDYTSKSNSLLQTVLSFCGNENLRCFSALPDMAKAMDVGTMLYGPNLNSHPVGAGYRVIAESISTYLSTHVVY